MQASDESFVDLYELLDLWPDASDAQLRRRLSELYLEARENLEHQNHRKRFYYRELYEVQLPQARLILLDAARRAEYDSQLQQFWAKKGKLPDSRKPKGVSGRTRLSDLPGVAPAADDFSDFADIEESNLPPVVAPYPRMERERVERRRDNKRRELIRHELFASGFRWGLIGAAAAVAICTLLLAILVFIFPRGIAAAIGVADQTFLIGCFIAMTLAASLSGREAMRWSRRRIIGLLSQMPYDELLRRCAGH